MSADPVCEALLSRLDRPLLASTVPTDPTDAYDDDFQAMQDPATMVRGGRGLEMGGQGGKVTKVVTVGPVS